MPVGKSTAPSHDLHGSRKCNRIVGTILAHALAALPALMHDCKDAGGTPPWKEVVEPRLERRPRAKQEARAEEVGWIDIFYVVSAVTSRSGDVYER